MPSAHSSPSGGLPRSMQVPPFPSHPHRKLRLSVHSQGLLLRPVASQSDGNIATPTSPGRGALIRWGVKGRVEVWDGIGLNEGDEVDINVELGGVLGLVRLWDAAYLMAFLPSKASPRPIFAAHKAPATTISHSASTDSLNQDLPASTHEVFTLDSIHAIPLVPDLAKKTLQALSGLQTKAKKAAEEASMPALASRALNRWSIPLPGMTKRPAGSVTDGETEAEGGTDTEAEAETTSIEAEEDAIVRGGSATSPPEADEAPNDIMDLADDRATAEEKKKFNIGWGMFVPKLPRKNRKPVASELGPREALPPIVDEPMKEASQPESNPSDNRSSTDSAPFASDPPQRRELESKILRELIRELSSGAFFYSFDFDLTHSLQHKRQLLKARSTAGTLLATLLTKNASQEGTFPISPVSEVEADIGDSRKLGEAFNEASSDNTKSSKDTYAGDDFVEPDVHVPLWRRVDRRFFWNEYMARDFIELGLHAYILPIMQGWFQSSTFSIPVPPNPLDPTATTTNVPVDLVVISRRSKDRAGLRYQRRGIDDEGHVANMVETEMIVRATIEGKPSLFSFVQVRGSIPLRWSQSPYALKPVPVVDKPVQESLVTGKMHFDDLVGKYGKQTIVNLSELTGKEGEVTNGYRELVKQLDRKDVSYEEFDFHNECKGMKYENISKLVHRLESVFADQGYYWACQDEVMREQSGTFRTNCIDCLDRTNVVQSAFARYVLSNMLTQMGLVPTQLANVEAVFNDVWANNGDAISQSYAGTSALKGDFTRTGKRDLTGMWHDGLNSLARMYSGAVSDFFSQAVISFLLGQRNLSVFSEFLETLQSSEASSLIRLSRVRTAAIEICSSRVLSAGESRLHGWTLLSPEVNNTKIGTKLEEKIVILSRQALYVVSFNYSLEKVIGFTRVPLGSITKIQKGAYILSPLQEAGRDPIENSGLMVFHKASEDGTRYSSYSIHNQQATPAEPPVGEVIEYYALKALPREFVNHGADGDDSDKVDGEVEGKVGETCRDVVDRIVSRIKFQRSKLGFEEEEGFVVEEDVVGLAEAQRSTSIASRMDYALKRFLWL